MAAAAALISKTSHHVRTFSLPSKHHPIVGQFDEQLCRLRSSQTTSTSSSSSLSHRLSGLKDLYACFDELLLLPINQQTLAQDFRSSSSIVLDGSLRLLDICATARDALLNSRKEVKRPIKKCFREIKKVEENGETRATFSMLKDVEATTAEIFRSLLIHIAGSKMQSKRSGWSLVSKLVHQSSEKEEATSISKFENLDSALSSLISQKRRTVINMKQAASLKRQMENLESEIQDLDELLENLFRHLVKTRATFLNVLSNWKKEKLLIQMKITYTWRHKWYYTKQNFPQNSISRFPFSP